MQSPTFCSIFLLAGIAFGDTAAAQPTTSEEIQKLQDGGKGPYYMTLEAGLSMAGGDVDVSDGLGTTGTFDVKKGAVVGGSVGRRFGKNIRLETAVTWRPHKFSDATVTALLVAITIIEAGKVGTFTAMVNGFLDFPIPSAWRLQAYIGGGAGIARVNVQTGSAGLLVIQDRDNVFAYNGAAGFALPLGYDSATHVTLGYRYLRVSGGTFDVSSPLLLGTVPVDLGSDDAHEFMLGFRHFL